MSREELPKRRATVTLPVSYKKADGSKQTYIVSFGIAPDGKIKEWFCTSLKSGSDLQALLNDASIAVSIALQTGTTMRELADKFGERRAEGENTGPPDSPLGAIARAGAALEADEGYIKGLLIHPAE